MSGGLQSCSSVFCYTGELLCIFLMKVASFLSYLKISKYARSFTGDSSSYSYELSFLSPLLADVFFSCCITQVCAFWELSNVWLLFIDYCFWTFFTLFLAPYLVPICCLPKMYNLTLWCVLTLLFFLTSSSWMNSRSRWLLSEENLFPSCDI